MTQNNNFSVLPWYKSIEEQNHRKSYAFGNIYPLFSPANNMLPFQLMRDTRANAISSVIIYSKNGTQISNITQSMKETGLKVVRFASLGYDVIVYPGTLPMPINMKPGMYYATMSDGKETWYSEIFTAVVDLSGYLKIEWGDYENFVFDAGQVVYRNPTFKNVLYFSSELGKPEYEFNEDGKDRDGYFFVEKQVSEKTYKATVLAPEYLCDVMRFIRLSDFTTVTDKYGRIYNCDTFLITPKWETQGDIASVEIEFQTQTVIKKIGRGVIVRSNGDFNNDFSNDFKNQTNE